METSDTAGSYLAASSLPEAPVHEEQSYCWLPRSTESRHSLNCRNGEMARKFPVIAWEFLVTPKYFPVSLTRELSQKWLQRNGFWLGDQVSEPPNRKFPCKIPCWQGICLETGAISTASPASQSLS